MSGETEKVYQELEEVVSSWQIHRHRELKSLHTSWTLMKKSLHTSWTLQF